MKSLLRYAAATALAKGSISISPGHKGRLGKRTLRMDARTNIKSRSGRRVGLARATRSGASASDEATNAALHLPAMDLPGVEIFKKTPCAAGLKPSGRYVAKDMYDVGGLPLLMKTLLDNGHLHGDCLTVTGRTITENLKSVQPITATGSVVGRKGYLAPQGAVVKVAGMLQDGDIIEIDAEVGTLDVKLSDAELAEHKTKWRPGATNHRSGALWKHAQQVGPAVDGAVNHSGGAHEKLCYADI